MDAIFKNENVYVVVRRKDIRDEVNSDNLENLIIKRDYSFNQTTYLYGGRVYLKVNSSDGTCSINVDGIILKCFSYNSSSDKHDLEQIAAYLNQIENLGVDSFLENYKTQLKELKKEFEIVAESMRQELTMNYNEKKAEVLDSIEKSIIYIACIIFLLMINMNAGLQNHDYINAYDTIINLYF